MDGIQHPIQRRGCMDITKEFRFEASHQLIKHKGKCSRLHGHSWVLEVTVSGEVDEETGFVMDYADIGEIVKPLIDALDHRHLGTWGQASSACHFQENRVMNLPFDFYPSSENIILWIGDQLDTELKWSKLKLNETCTSSCVITREEYERTVRSRSESVTNHA
jgi:6-pyruvoyltetrahydropterin/6-carboxytetrahydropterin synthase